MTLCDLIINLQWKAQDHWVKVEVDILNKCILGLGAYLRAAYHALHNTMRAFCVLNFQQLVELAYCQILLMIMHV